MPRQISNSNAKAGPSRQGSGASSIRSRRSSLGPAPAPSHAPTAPAAGPSTSTPAYSNHHVLRTVGGKPVYRVLDQQALELGFKKSFSPGGQFQGWTHSDFVCERCSANPTATCLIPAINKGEAGNIRVMACAACAQIRKGCSNVARLLNPQMFWDPAQGAFVRRQFSQEPEEAGGKRVLDKRARGPRRSVKDSALVRAQAQRQGDKTGTGQGGAARGGADDALHEEEEEGEMDGRDVVLDWAGGEYGEDEMSDPGDGGDEAGASGNQPDIEQDASEEDVEMPRLQDHAASLGQATTRAKNSKKRSTPPPRTSTTPTHSPPPRPHSLSLVANSLNGGNTSLSSAAEPLVLSPRKRRRKRYNVAPNLEPLRTDNAPETETARSGASRVEARGGSERYEPSFSLGDLGARDEQISGDFDGPDLLSFGESRSGAEADHGEDGNWVDEEDTGEHGQGASNSVKEGNALIGTSIAGSRSDRRALDLMSSHGRLLSPARRPNSTPGRPRHSFSHSRPHAPHLGHAHSAGSSPLRHSTSSPAGGSGGREALRRGRSSSNHLSRWNGSGKGVGSGLSGVHRPAGLGPAGYADPALDQLSIVMRSAAAQSLRAVALEREVMSKDEALAEAHRAARRSEVEKRELMDENERLRRLVSALREGEGDEGDEDVDDEDTVRGGGNGAGDGVDAEAGRVKGDRSGARMSQTGIGGEDSEEEEEEVVEEEV